MILNKCWHFSCVYPDVCLGIAHVSGKVPLSGQGVWQIHNVSAPFALQIPWGEKSRYIVYLPDPLSRERDFTHEEGCLRASSNTNLTDSRLCLVPTLGRKSVLPSKSVLF